MKTISKYEDKRFRRTKLSSVNFIDKADLVVLVVFKFTGIDEALTVK